MVVIEASGGCGGAPSSAARTTSLLDILLPCLGRKEIPFLDVELVFGAKLDFSTNPDAALAMLHVAIVNHFCSF